MRVSGLPRRQRILLQCVGCALLGSPGCMAVPPRWGCVLRRQGPRTLAVNAHPPVRRMRSSRFAGLHGGTDVVVAALAAGAGGRWVFGPSPLLTYLFLPYLASRLAGAGGAWPRARPQSRGRLPVTVHLAAASGAFLSRVLGQVGPPRRWRVPWRSKPGGRLAPGIAGVCGSLAAGHTRNSDSWGEPPRGSRRSPACPRGLVPPPEGRMPQPVGAREGAPAGSPACGPALRGLVGANGWSTVSPRCAGGAAAAGRSGAPST